MPHVAMRCSETIKRQSVAPFVPEEVEFLSWSPGVGAAAPMRYHKAIPLLIARLELGSFPY